MIVVALFCGAIPFIAGLAVYFRYSQKMNFHSSAIPIGLAISVVPPVLLLVLNLYFLRAGYHGLCEGPPDYSAACTYPEYLKYHLFNGFEVFGYGLLCALSLGWAGVVFGALGYYFGKHHENTQR